MAKHRRFQHKFIIRICKLRSKSTTNMHVLSKYTKRLHDAYNRF